MQRDRDRDVEELFADALELPEAERSAWLARACGSNPELRAEVDSLLRAFALAPRLMDRSMLGVLKAAPPADPATDPLGSRMSPRVANGPPHAGARSSVQTRRSDMAPANRKGVEPARAPNRSLISAGSPSIRNASRSSGGPGWTGNARARTP